MVNYFQDETGYTVVGNYNSTDLVEAEMEDEMETEVEAEVEAERTDPSDRPAAASGQRAFNIPKMCKWLSFDENGEVLIDDAYFRRPPPRALAEAKEKPGALISDPCRRRPAPRALAVAKKKPKGLH
jgi:hypothetical protein